MAYTAFVTRIKNMRPHPNADRLQMGECFGNTVIVSLEYVDNQLGIYFPSDGQLSVEFAEANNLLRKKDDAGNNIGGYMDPNKRNVTAIKLRGEKSDGLFMPLEALAQFGDVSTLREGDRIETFNGYEICCKYIPRRNVRHGAPSEGNKTRKKKVDVAPLFMEHADTEQLAYNLGAFKPGDEIEITLKMHGTSQRTGYLPIQKEGTYSYTSLFKAVLHKLIPVRKWRNAFGEKYGVAQYEYDYISGTRRTVLEDFNGGFYGSNEFRKQHHDKFVGKLYKGETVYYEVVGFTQTGAPIMASCDNKKLQDKEFVKQYGKTTVFSYGCHPNGWNDKDGGYNLGRCEPQSDIYVYRMTMTNEDGEVVEYTPDFMRYRCEQMGVKTVPVFTRVILPSDEYFDEEHSVGNYVKEMAEQYYDGADPIGKTHVREGVVVRIINRPKFCAYKHKNWYFKALEGIVKVEAEAPDMEEADGGNDGEEIN